MPEPSKRQRVEEAMDVDENPTSENGGSSQNNGENSDVDHISDDEEGGMRIGDIYIPPAPKPTLSFDTTGPRLIITHIVNENFKSYAGVQSLGPFHKSFTAIIGPNGSGKSNVIDSMLFVFGYRASKIRTKKISVLLHSSSKFPNVNSASVAVHFCQIIDGEGDAYTVVPNSEIVVSRTAFRDSTSFYTLNGRRVQFKEVARMLRSHGIDLDHNRFLILQGEVEQIAMMKPKAQTEHDTGMLEYLEDITGTSRYKEPIEKLSVRVEEYSEMRKEKLNRVRLVEQEKQKLEQPMREAVDLMNLTNTALRTRNMLLQKYIHETNKIIESKNKELDELKESLKQVDDKLAQVKQQLQDKSTELKNGTQQYDEMQKRKDEIGDRLQSCKRTQVSVQADTTQANKKKNNLEDLLKTERGKLIELEMVPERNEREIADCEVLLNKHKESKRQAEAELETLMAGVREQTRGFQEQKDRLQSKLIDLKKIFSEADKNFKLAESELKIYLVTETKEQEKLDKMRDSFEKAEKDLDEKKVQRSILAKELPAQEIELTRMQSRMQRLKSEEVTLEREARTLRKQLEESKQTMNANRSKGRVLDSLMREKQSGRLPGIFGRLGDLGGIDATYDVAISTCCGALDNIVVDSVDTAQACVEFLRRNDVGRATFIALDKQQHLLRYCQNKTTYPENAPRLFDLVRVRDDRVLPAFYFALRDTLVARELEQAARVAYGATRYRVVTIAGDVIEIAGTMSGGGRSVLRGRMSSSVQQDTSEIDPAALRENERKLDELTERLAEIRNEETTLEETVASLMNRCQEGKRTMSRLDFDLNTLMEQVPNLKKQIEEQEKRLSSFKVDEAQKKRLEEKVKSAEEAREQAQYNAGEIEKEVSGVDAQIASVAGNKVKEMQKNVEDLTKKIEKLSSEITKLRVAINTSKRNAKKSKDKISQMESDLADTLKNLESLGNQKKQLTLDIGELQKNFGELDEQINEGTGQFAGLRKEITALQENEKNLKSERLEANNAVVKMEKTIKECSSKTPLWERELQSLRLEDPGIDIPGIERPTPLVRHSPEELEECSVEELRNRLSAQKARVGEAKPNLQAIQDYRAKEEVYMRRAAELDDITNKRNEMRALFDQLRKKRTTDFLSGFNIITTKLKEMYQMITLGGDAELELVDSLDPFTEGIIFSVRPPSKSWKNISNLSGGEKTLASLALVFALHYYKPTPLYVMDEIDAALDFKNISIVANYIKERTKNAQFIIISLRYNMFEASNRLVGIYKTQDCTKSVTIENKEPEDKVAVEC
ncbi:structural maintenance of chromosomes protein 4 [Leptidea sinapis]|uniref:structural maintenance of chromosomes protein 4 n=1 Tax=Leptidea sinapis TaxID=189913 RepID=UPI002146E2A3|nr:structural maintenance of chromosomes protein 4 [Leptidea sinapis]